MKRNDRLTTGSMGSFLCPPNHPMYKYSVEMDLNRKKENRGLMAIEYALKQDYISDKTKKEIQQLLSEWESNKLPLNTEGCIKWIENVHRHFAGTGGATYFIKQYYPNYLS